MKKTIFIITFCLVTLYSVNGQILQEGQILWNSEKKLTVEDFKIEMKDSNNDTTYSQFMISHSISGFDFMKRNLNQKITNIFLGNASWIDKTIDVQKQLEYQQMQFDIAEIYTRRFRKKVLINKGQISKGFDIINKINNEIMSELSTERIRFVKETENGQNLEKMIQWKENISRELKEMDEFSYENKSKIKLNK